MQTSNADRTAIAERLEARLREMLFVETAPPAVVDALCADLVAYTQMLPRKAKVLIPVSAMRLVVPFILLAWRCPAVKIVIEAPEQLATLNLFAGPGTVPGDAGEAMALCMCTFHFHRTMDVKYELGDAVNKSIGGRREQRQGPGEIPEHYQPRERFEAFKVALNERAIYEFERAKKAAYFQVLTAFARALPAPPAPPAPLGSPAATLPGAPAPGAAGPSGTSGAIDGANAGRLYIEEARTYLQPSRVMRPANRKVFIRKGNSGDWQGLDTDVLFGSIHMQNPPPRDSDKDRERDTGVTESMRVIQDAGFSFRKAGYEISSGSYGIIYALWRVNGKCFKVYNGTDWNKNGEIIWEIFMWQYLLSLPLADDYIVKLDMLFTKFESAATGSVARDAYLVAEMRLYQGSLNSLVTDNSNKIKAMTDSDRAVFWHNIALKYAQGLAWIHSQGVAHGDVKPENVLYMFSDREIRDIRSVDLRFTDFGLVFVTDFEKLDIYAAARVKQGQEPIEFKAVNNAAVNLQSWHLQTPELMARAPCNLNAARSTDVFAYGVTMLSMYKNSFITCEDFNHICDAVGYPSRDTTRAIEALLRNGATDAIKNGWQEIARNFRMGLREIEYWLRYDARIPSRMTPMLMKFSAAHPLSIMLTAASPDMEGRPTIHEIATMLRAAPANTDIYDIPTEPWRIRPYRFQDISPYTDEDRESLRKTIEMVDKEYNDKYQQ